MKKAIGLLIIAVLALSCGSSGSATSGSAKISKRTLKGTWQVTNIKFVGDKGLYKANLFDIADSLCFIDSQWVFIPNNGSGKFSINSTKRCDSSSNRIHWSIYGSSQFQFYFTNEKNKPLDATKKGFRCTIDELDADTMVLRIPTTYEGNPFDVVLTFNKSSDDITL